MVIAVVTDSTSDLPVEWAKKNQVTIIPTILVMGDKQYADGKGITRQEFYEQLNKNNPPPTTASPAPATFQKVYEDLFSRGIDHIFSIHVASTLSSVYNTAAVTAKQFGQNISVIDSGQVSLGLGFQVMAAVEAINKGADIAGVFQAIENLVKRLRLFAMLDTLDQLQRSGRVSWMRASLGSLIQVKMFIQVIEGQVQRLGELRTRGKAIQRLRQMLADLGSLERLAILHTNAEAEAKSLLAEFSHVSSAPPLLANVTTVIGTHVGAHALGFAAVLPE
jgi:DegV family protein with EDD domain